MAQEWWPLKATKNHSPRFIFMKSKLDVVICFPKLLLARSNISFFFFFIFDNFLLQFFQFFGQTIRHKSKKFEWWQFPGISHPERLNKLTSLTWKLNMLLIPSILGIVYNFSFESYRTKFAYGNVPTMEASFWLEGGGLMSICDLITTQLGMWLEKALIEAHSDNNAFSWRFHTVCIEDIKKILIFCTTTSPIFTNNCSS